MQSDRVSGLTWRKSAYRARGRIMQSDGVIDGLGKREMHNMKEESD